MVHQALNLYIDELNKLNVLKILYKKNLFSFKFFFLWFFFSTFFFYVSYKKSPLKIVSKKSFLFFFLIDHETSIIK